MILGPIAYMDPGTGSLFLQLLLGGIAGMLVFLKLFWHKVLSIFGLQQKRESDGNKFDVPDPKPEGNPKP